LIVLYQVSTIIFYRLPLPVDEEIVKLAVEIRRGTFSSQCLEIEDIDTEPYPQLVTVIKDIYKYLNELEVVVLFPFLVFSFPMSDM
jgi:hypothetical protein